MKSMLMTPKGINILLVTSLFEVLIRQENLSKYVLCSLKRTRRQSYKNILKQKQKKRKKLQRVMKILIFKGKMAGKEPKWSPRSNRLL